MQSHLDSSDVGHDTKLDTSSEPNAALIADNIILPKDRFNSYLSYLLYEIAHFKPIMLCFLVILISSLSIVVFHHSDGLTTLFIVLIFFTSLSLLISLIPFNNPISEEGFIIRFLLEVIARKPAFKGKEWRTIAYNMNQRLFDDGLWNTPYYFYSESECYEYFRSLFKRQNSNVQLNSSTNNAGNAQSDTSETEVSNRATKSYCFSPDPILEAYYVKAVEVEGQARREYWKTQYPDADIP